MLSLFSLILLFISSMNDSLSSALNNGFWLADLIGCDFVSCSLPL
ncbi:unnamed protein product [Schistosoma mattheei]|uniref:Uncharacterized protein n=1 Tax=Schistosoma mattheei TaxID=31246 RepID=A0A3P8DEB3_9TREM|nr:unnamed protein product [Schistosoma mattheei]